MGRSRRRRCSVAETSSPVAIRFAYGGMNLRDVADALAPGKFSMGLNIRDTAAGSICTRPGYVAQFSTSNNAITDIRSYAALGTDDLPRFLARDASGTIWLDSGNNVATLAGTPGLGVRMIPFRPASSPQSWMYVADRGDYVKISAPDANNNTTVQKVGIAEPQFQCEAAPQTLVYTNFSAPANNWAANGTVGTPTDENRTTDTVGAVFTDPVNSGRSSIQVTATDAYAIGQTFVAGSNNNTAYSLVQDVLPPASQVAIQGIRYASGNNGACVIVPAQLPVGQASFVNQLGFLRRGALIQFSGNNETALVLSVTVGPDGSQCVETSTVGSHNSTETLKGLPTIVADGAFSTSQPILSVDVKTTATPGIGTLTQTFATSPFAATMGASGSLPQQDDYIHFSVNVSDYTQVLEIALRFNVDPVDTTVTQNYYEWVVTQNVLAVAVAGASASTQNTSSGSGSSSSSAGEAAAIQQQISILQQKLAMAQSGTGEFSNNPYGRTQAIAGLTQAISSLTAQLAALSSSSSTTSTTGSTSGGLSAVAASQWAEILIPISSLTRIGGDASRSLSDCNAVQIYINTTGAGTAVWVAGASYSLNQEILDTAGHTQKVTTAGVSGTITPTWNDTGGTTTDGTVVWTDQGIVAASTIVRIGSFWVGGGGDPDTGTGGAPYRYRVVPYSSLTGATGNPSPDMRYGVTPRRQRITVDLPSADYDAQIDTWLIFRYGGTVTTFRFIGSCPSDTPGFIDRYFDDTAQGGSLMVTDNFEPWPSVDVPYNPQDYRSHFGSTLGIQVFGNQIVLTETLGTWPATINNWLPGTLVRIGGENVFTLRTRPVQISSTKYLFNIQECAGYIGSAGGFLVAEPIVARAFAPWAWGPDAQGTVFAVGDSMRPGVVNFSKPYAPDACQNAALELVPPSEPLIGGQVMAGLSLVASSARWWALYPAFQSAQLYEPIEQTVGRGLVSPFGICTDGAKIYFWAKDCIASHSGGAYEDLTFNDLRDLFPHDGVQGEDRTRNGVTIHAPDYSKAGTFRLRCAGGYLYADYTDSTGGRSTLVMNLETKAWMSDAYNDAITVHYGPEQQEGTLASAIPALYPTLLMGDSEGKVWKQQADSNDSWAGISCVVGTREVDGQQGPSQLWRNQYLDLLTAGGATAVPMNMGNPVTTQTTIAAKTDRQFAMVRVGPGSECRFLGMQINWTATTAPPPPIILPQTGVWLSHTNEGTADQGQTAGDGATVNRGATGGTIALVHTSPGADWGQYPRIILEGFGNTPAGAKYDWTLHAEWIQFRTKFSANLVIGNFQINFFTRTDDGNIHCATAYSFEGNYLSSGTGVITDYTFTDTQAVNQAPYAWVPFGYKDELQNSLLTTVLNGVVVDKLGSSTFFTSSDPATATVTDTALAFYFDAIRVNCGSAIPISMLQERYPLGTYSFKADNPLFVTGGTAEVINTPEVTVYDSRRYGSDFTYTFGPGLFSDYYAHSKYLVMLYLVDPVSTAAGQNVFTVTINGVVVDTIDIFALTGHIGTNYHVEYPITVAGKANLVINLHATTGEAMLSGIRVAPVPPDDPESNNSPTGPVLSTEIFLWLYQGVPNGVLEWATQPSNFGISGFKSIPRMEFVYTANADVTFLVTSDGTSPAALTLPSTGGLAAHVYFTLTPNKGTLYAFAASSTDLYQIILAECTFSVAQWGRQGEMAQLHEVV